MGDEEKKNKKKKKKKQSKKEDDDTTNFYSAFKCAQLRKRLGELGLKQSGLKSELIARLREADEVDRELAAAGVDGYEGLAAAITAAAADAAAAAATAKAAAAAASAAASPIATASYALPPIILDGPFEGYMSPRHVMELKMQIQRRTLRHCEHAGPARLRSLAGRCDRRATGAIHAKAHVADRNSIKAHRRPKRTCRHCRRRRRR